MNDQKVRESGRKRKAINNKSAKISGNVNSKNEIAKVKKMKADFGDDKPDVEDKLIPSFGKKRKRSSIANVEKSECSQSDKANNKQKETVEEEVPNQMHMDEQNINENPKDAFQSGELNLSAESISNFVDKIYNTNEVSAFRKITNYKDVNCKDISGSKPLDNVAADINFVEVGEQLDKDSPEIPVILNEAAKALDAIVNTLANADSKKKVDALDSTESTYVCPNSGDQTESKSVCPNPGDQTESTSVCPNPNQIESTFVCPNPVDQTESTSVCPNPNQTESTSVCPNPNQIEPTFVCPNPVDQIESTFVCPNPNQTESTFLCSNPVDQTESTSVCPNPDQTESTSVCPNPDQTESTSVCPNPGDQTESTSVCFSLGDQTKSTFVCPNLDLNPSLIQHQVSMCLDRVLVSKPVTYNEEEKTKAFQYLKLNPKSTLVPDKIAEHALTSLCLKTNSKSDLLPYQDVQLKTTYQCMETDTLSTLVSERDIERKSTPQSLDTNSVLISEHDRNEVETTTYPKTKQSITKKNEDEEKMTKLLTLNTGSSSTPTTKHFTEEGFLCPTKDLVSTQNQHNNEDKTLVNVCPEIENPNDLVKRSSSDHLQKSDCFNSLQKGHCHDEYVKLEEKIKQPKITETERYQENNDNQQFINIQTNEKLKNISKSQQMYGQKKLNSTNFNSNVKENIFFNKNCVMQLEDPFPPSETVKGVETLSVQDESLCDSHVIQSDLNWKADTVKCIASSSDTNLMLKGSQAINRDHQNSSNKGLITEIRSAIDSVVSSDRCLITGSSSPLLKSTKEQAIPAIQEDADLSDTQLCEIDLEQSQSTLKFIAAQTKQKEEGKKVIRNLISDMQYLNKLVLKTKREIETAYRKKQQQLPQMWKTNAHNTGQSTRKF